MATHCCPSCPCPICTGVTLGRYAYTPTPQSMWSTHTTSPWQKCPVCAGHGKIASGLPNTQMGGRDTKCPTCNGKRIINAGTGKPPK